MNSFIEDVMSFDGDEEVCPAACDWVRATDADVRRDNLVRHYRALLALPVGTTVEDRYNRRLWRLRVVSRATDPTTRFAKDVRGWICRPRPASTMLAVASAGGHWPRCRGVGPLPQTFAFSFKSAITGRGGWGSPVFQVTDWNVRADVELTSIPSAIQEVHVDLLRNESHVTPNYVVRPPIRSSFTCWWGTQPGSHEIVVWFLAGESGWRLTGQVRVQQTSIRPEPGR